MGEGGGEERGGGRPASSWNCGLRFKAMVHPNRTFGLLGGHFVRAPAAPKAAGRLTSWRYWGRFWCTSCGDSRCCGVLVMFDSNELALLSGAVECQRIGPMSLCRKLQYIQQAPHALAGCSQNCFVCTSFASPCPLTCCVVHPLVWTCTCHARVGPEVSEPTFGVRELPPQLTPQCTLLFATTKATPLSAFLTRISRAPLLSSIPSAHWTSVF